MLFLKEAAAQNAARIASIMRHVRSSAARAFLCCISSYTLFKNNSDHRLWAYLRLISSLAYRTLQVDSFDQQEIFKLDASILHTYVQRLITKRNAVAKRYLDENSVPKESETSWFGRLDGDSEANCSCFRRNAVRPKTEPRIRSARK